MNKNFTNRIIHIALILLSFTFVLPLLLLISSSLSTDEEVVKYGLGLFARKPVFTAYKAVFDRFESIIKAF